MPQALTAVPNLKLPGQKARDLSRRQASKLRGFKLGDFAQISEDERISLFPGIDLRIAVGRLLTALTAIVLGLLLLGHFSQIGAFFSGFIYDPRNASISGDPVITGMVDWLPILLVALSTVVLAGLVINRAQYRRTLQQPGPRLVTRQQAPKAPDARPPQDHTHLFIVARTPENRHEAQEQVRLERDAHAAALARAAAADRLVVSGTLRVHQSEALVIPRPRRTLASMPPQASPRMPHSGVFFPAAATPVRATPVRKPSPACVPRFHLSRAPHTPPAIL